MNNANSRLRMRYKSKKMRHGRSSNNLFSLIPGSRDATHYLVSGISLHRTTTQIEDLQRLTKPLSLLPLQSELLKIEIPIGPTESSSDTEQLEESRYCHWLAKLQTTLTGSK